MEIRRRRHHGAGVMERGIATTFARAGFEAVLASRDHARIEDLPGTFVAVRKLPAEPASDLAINRSRSVAF